MNHLSATIDIFLWGILNLTLDSSVEKCSLEGKRKWKNKENI